MTVLSTTEFDPWRVCIDSLGLGDAYLGWTDTRHGTKRTFGGFGTVVDSTGAAAPESSFTLSLPVSEGRAPAAAAGADGDLTDRTILVIDDEELVRGVVRTMLVKAGCRVREADDGAEGVAIFAAEHDRLDAVILDMAMPVMGGAECYRRLREIDPEARIIVSSGFADGEVIDESSTPGRAGLLHKPFRRKDLLAALRAALPAADAS